MIDDLQWSDEDSLRLLRYVVRTDGASPIFLMFAIRPEEFAVVNEAVNLVADMGRMGVVRRLKLERFSQTETREFLAQVLGGPVDASGAAVMHAQAEGVPFIVEEMAFTYRENGMIQEIDGVWTLAGNAERLVPSAVRTLISRRATKLPDETKALLAVAAILGRRFSLKDLREIQLRVDGSAPEPEELAETLAPAVTAGLLVEHEEASAADYSFPHEQVREFAAATLTSAARRAIHAAIVDLLMSGEPSAASLPLDRPSREVGGRRGRVRPVLGRGEPERARGQRARRRSCASSSWRCRPASTPRATRRAPGRARPGARHAAAARGPDAGARRARRAGRGARRHAPGDRRPAAPRRGACGRPRSTSARRSSRARCGTWPWSEATARASSPRAWSSVRTSCTRRRAKSFTPAAKEVDLDACDEAFRRAMELAQELGDVAAEAAATREVGVVQLGRVRAWFIEQLELGLHLPMVQRVAAGEVLEDIMPELPIAPAFMETFGLFQHALELFEQLGDRRGAMSTIIALAYLNWAPDIHLGTSSARHIEEIRRLTSRMKAFTNESERAAFEAQMLYGSHVFARAKVDPRPGARERPRRPTDYAREIGDPNLEFLAAGGTAMSRPRPRRRRRGQGRGSTARRRSPPSTRGRSGRAGSRPGGGSPTRRQATPRACAHTWSVPCSWRPTRACRPRDARRSPASRSSPRGWGCGSVTRS